MLKLRKKNFSENEVSKNVQMKIKMSADRFNVEVISAVSQQEP